MCLSPKLGKIADFLHKFDLFLSTKSSSNRDINIFGDFNINTLLDTTDLKNFEKSLKQHNLSLAKLPSTRRTEKNESSLDLIYKRYN